MKFRKNRAMALVAATLSATLLVSCSSGGGGSEVSGSGDGADGKSYELTFWVYSDFVQDASGKLMNEFVDEFIDEHPNVKSVKLVPKNDAELLSGAMAGVGLPDAFSASARDAVKYENALPLLDLSPIFDDADFADGFYKDALKAVTNDDGKWAIPFISYIPVIYRNLDALEKAGIDPSEGTPTYDAFLDQLQKVKDAGLTPTHSWTNNGYFAPGAVMASDAKSITSGEADGKTTVSPDQLVKSFETVAAINKFGDQALNNEADATMEAFKTGKLAFLLGGPWIEPNFKNADVNYDIVLVPSYEKGGWTGGLQGWDFIYGVQTDDAERNDLVRAWLKKLGSYDAEKRWTTEVGRSTLRADVMDDKEVINSSPMAALSSEGLKEGMLQMDFGHSTVFWPSGISDAVAQLGTGDLTPKEAAEKAVAGINALYAEAGE
jgi:multiple sugar transport system substrate-binding protein